MRVAKSTAVKNIIVTIFLELVLASAQSLHGEEQENVQNLNGPQKDDNLIPVVDTINSELENIFRNKYICNGTRKCQKHRRRVATKKTTLKSNEGTGNQTTTDSVKQQDGIVVPQVPFCPIYTNYSESPFPFCWNQMNSNSYRLENPKSEINAGSTYIWNFNNINYNFYFPIGNSNASQYTRSLQEALKGYSDISGNEKERREGMTNVFIYPPKNIASLNFTNANEILSGMTQAVNKLPKANFKNSNGTKQNNNMTSSRRDNILKFISESVSNQIIPDSEISQDGANVELKQNESSTVDMHTTERVNVSKMMHGNANKNVDEELLRDIKASITQLHSKYFSVVSRQLSQKSKAGLGRDTLSFVISPLWLVLTIIQLSTGARGSTLEEIERVTRFRHSKEHKLKAMRLLVSKFPKNTRQIRLFGYTRLNVDSKLNVSSDFQEQANSSMGMNVSSLDMGDIETLTKELNRQIQNDTESCMKRSFDVSDLEYARPRAVLWNGAYLRAAWRSPPTVLNSSSVAHLVNGSTTQLRMYRLNDVMRLARVDEWNATVLEIRYKTRRLRQVIVIPHRPENLLAMESQMMKQKDLLGYLEPKLIETRVEATLPKYTLEMTLLLPNKLNEMGLGSSVTPKADFGEIWSGASGYITHAVQHVKLWAEEGRGAFKDDGLIWDPVPDIRVKVDNPYFFLIRLDDVILMSGHFAI